MIRANESPEPTAATYSVCRGSGGSAASSPGRRSISGGCGSASLLATAPHTL